MHIMSRKISRGVLSALAVLAFAAAPTAFAGHGHWFGRSDRGHGDYHDSYRGYHGRWDSYHGRWYHRRGDYAPLGGWVAGAVIAGALTNLVIDATAPQTIYYGAPPPPPVVYRHYRQPTVIYEEDAPTFIERRVEDPRVYDDPHRTRYIRDDGWDGHGN